MSISAKLLPVHKRLDVTFSHGSGVYLFDNNNNKYLDFGAGIAVNCLGHCHENLVKALNSQAQKLWHVSNLYCVSELNEYADKLTAKTFADYVFFCNSGAESIECSIKMIRKHFHDKGQSHKNKIITFEGAFHGRTLGTISAAAKKQYLQGFEPALPGFINVAFNDINAVKEAINDEVAGVLIEPIQGEGGIRVHDKKFIQDLRKLTKDNNILLALDEVQCGIGRTGHLFAYEYFDIIPDIVSTAKAIGGGYPLGACLSTKEAASGMTYGTHGTTYGGNPLAMSVADAVLETITQDNFLDQIKENSKILFQELKKLQNQYPNIIEEIRGVGYMIGIKISTNYLNSDIVSNALSQKLLTIPAGDNIVRLLPPLIITQEHIKEAITKLTKALQNTHQNNSNPLYTKVGN